MCRSRVAVFRTPQLYNYNPEVLFTGTELWHSHGRYIWYLFQVGMIIWNSFQWISTQTFSGRGWLWWSGGRMPQFYCEIPEKWTFRHSLRKFKHIVFPWFHQRTIQYPTCWCVAINYPFSIYHHRLAAELVWGYCDVGGVSAVSSCFTPRHTTSGPGPGAIAGG